MFPSPIRAALASSPTLPAWTSTAAAPVRRIYSLFRRTSRRDLGINGVSQNPFDWGLPDLSFTHFADLSDINPSLQRNQTLTFSDNMIWNHGKHTWRWGGDFRRIQLNTETDNNARGSFDFQRRQYGAACQWRASDQYWLRFRGFPARPAATNLGAIRRQQLSLPTAIPGTSTRKTNGSCAAT